MFNQPENSQQNDNDNNKPAQAVAETPATQTPLFHLVQTGLNVTPQTLMEMLDKLPTAAQVEAAIEEISPSWNRPVLQQQPLRVISETTFNVIQAEKHTQLSGRQSPQQK